MEPMQSRFLDNTEVFQSIANTVTTVFAELKRIKDSEELKQIFQKGEKVIETVSEAAQDAAKDMNEIIVLALQIYEKSLLRSRSLIIITPLSEISSRQDFIDQVLVRVQSPETEAEDSAA